MTDKLILYIEDNVRLRENVCEVLQMQGYGVISTSLGLEGLRMAAYRHPDLILLDTNLPDIHGGVVLAQLKKSPGLEHVPVIAVTGDRITTHENYDACLIKPFKIVDFIAVVQRFLEAAEQQQ